MLSPNVTFFCFRSTTCLCSEIKSKSKETVFCLRTPKLRRRLFNIGIIISGVLILLWTLHNDDREPTTCVDLLYPSRRSTYYYYKREYPRSRIQKVMVNFSPEKFQLLRARSLARIWSVETPNFLLFIGCSEVARCPTGYCGVWRLRITIVVQLLSLAILELRVLPLNTETSLRCPSLPLLLYE